MWNVGPEIRLGRQLARRLLPVVLAIGCLISVGFPASFYLFETIDHRNIATNYASDLGGKLEELILDGPEFWKYRSEKYRELLRDFLPYKDVTAIRVLDEVGRPIQAFDFATASKGAWWSRYPLSGSAPILFNNRRLGTVEVGVSPSGVLGGTLALFLISVAVGGSLALVVYRFPVQVVTGLEGQIRDLVEALAKRTRHLETVRAVTAEVSRELDLSTVLHLIHKRAMDLVGAVSGTLYLWDDTAQFLIPKAWHRRGEWVAEVRLRLGEGIAGMVAQQREGLIVNDLRTSPYAAPIFLERTAATAVMAEPLLHRDRLVGVIVIAKEESGGTFGEHDRELLALFAAHAAVAIENARLHEEVRGLAALEERERIAREMHDGLAQALGLLHLKLQDARERAVEAGRAGSTQDLQEMIAITDRAYEEVRQSIFGLRTRISRRLGFIPTLTEYLHEFNVQNGIAVEIETPDDRQFQLPPASEVQLIRIVQEALTNVRRHARTDRAWVRLDRDGPWIRVTIEDHGRGFEPGTLASSGRLHFGLRGMQERAEGLGGKLEVDTAPGRGTRIAAMLPGES
jgi:signal transduction histidine kinase